MAPGAVLTAGNVYLKVTNAGLIATPSPTSRRPFRPMAGASGTEYSIHALGGGR